MADLSFQHEPTRVFRNLRLSRKRHRTADPTRQGRTPPRSGATQQLAIQPSTSRGATWLSVRTADFASVSAQGHATAPCSAPNTLLADAIVHQSRAVTDTGRHPLHRSRDATPPVSGDKTSSPFRLGRLADTARRHAAMKDRTRFAVWPRKPPATRATKDPPQIRRPHVFA